MKTIDKWSDLEAFGIVPLTGEACALGYRMLCDLTQNGKRIVEKCLSVEIQSENWNHGSDDDPHVASVMLPPAMLVPLGIFTLLESGCSEVWLYKKGGPLGIEPSDTPEIIEVCRKMAPEAFVRSFAYRGPFQDRNRHQMSGRVR